MKFIKNIFGIKNGKNKKFEGNTLADTNGFPDARSDVSDENTVVATVTKKDEGKKAPKVSTLTPKDLAMITAKKSENNAEKAAPKNSAPAKKTTPTAEKSTKKPTESVADKTPKATKSAPEKAETKATVAKDSVSKAKSATKSEETKKEVNTADSAKKNAVADTATATKNTTKKKAETPEVAEEITVTKSARTGKFEIKKSKDGRFVFNLYASNNVIVATSQVYSSSTSAMNGIKSVIANASTAPIEDQTLKNVTTVPFPKWEIYLDKGDQYRFRLCASNGSCVCHSQGYTAKTNCKKGIESIIKFASDAEITKVYLEKKGK